MNLLSWWPPRAERQPLAAPEIRAAPLLALHGLAAPSWSAEAGPGLAQEGFARNPVVYRCVRLVAEAAASLTPLAYDGQGEELLRHPALDLLARPNPRQARQVFLERLYGHLLVAGEGFVQAVALDGALRELHALRPDRLTPVAGPDGWPEAFDHQAGSTRTRLRADGPQPDVLHLTLANPLDDTRGLAPLSAARMALDIHNAASRWNKALLDNSARPSGALVYTAGEGANLSEAQFERLKGELEAGYAGAARAGRPMVLEGGLDWKAMGFSPRDMDFQEAKNGAARELALAFGVPPMLLGIPGDNTFSNFQEANRALWRNTVMPLASRTLEALAAFLSDWSGDDLRLDFDRDAIEALSADREALWARVGEAAFLTMDEKRAACGYGPLGDAVPDAGRQDPDRNGD